MSRATKAYVSAYTPDRMHGSVMQRTEKRTYAADFNAALLSDETLASAVWSIYTPSVLRLSGLTSTAGIVSVTAEAALAGCTAMLCLATTSTGRKLSQAFHVEVEEVMPGGEGATSLSWSA